MFESIEDIVLLLFLLVDQYVGELPQHPQAKLHPSEIVTLALLKPLKGQAYRRFHTWLLLSGWFKDLPDFSRLNRLFKLYKPTIEVLSRQLGDWSWLVIDSTGCEVIHPARENRGRGYDWISKGKSNYRWIVGMKVAVLVSSAGEIVDWAVDTANTHDQHFAGLVEQAEANVLADFGFHKSHGDPDNLVICQRGERNERMVVETVFSQCKGLLGLNDIQAKTREGFELTVATIFALFNILLEANRFLGLPSEKPAIAHFCVV